MGLTLAQKIRDSHTIVGGADEDLLYIDLQLLYEVGTSQAFDRLRASGRGVRRPDLNLATEDHNTPTRNLLDPIKDPDGRRQAELLRANCAEFGIPLHRRGEAGQGIVHVITPERGLARPGMTIVCCDSHTTTLGAFGALAFGIGASQVGHVLATQTLPVRRLRQMAVNVTGRLGSGATAKDLALAMIAQVGSAGAQGHIVEYRGEAISSLSMEARMTLCNMSVEMGSRAGLIAPDEVTVEYLVGRAVLPPGTLPEVAAAHWLTWRSDDDASFDRYVDFDAASVQPHVSWGTTPEQSAPIDGAVPDPEQFSDARRRNSARRALDYMDLRPGTAFRDIGVDTVFVGSCTNGRIEDLRAVAAVLDRRRVAATVEMIIVPGSAAVRRQAVDEGLDRIFAAAGADFRAGAGCSLCVALSEDRLQPGQRSASTSNRNFEGRQGLGARTHLVSPAVAAATAVAGRICSPEHL